MAIITMLGAKFVFFLALWLVGVAAYRLSVDGRYPPGLLRWPLLVTLPFAMVTSAQFPLIVDIGRSEIKPLLAVVAVTCGAALIAWQSVEMAFLRHTRGVNGFLASFSFTLYQIHFPVALFAIAGFVSLAVANPASFTGFQPLSVAGAIAFVGTSGVAVILAIVAASLTEWRTDAVRRMARQLF